MTPTVGPRAGTGTGTGTGTRPRLCPTSRGELVAELAEVVGAVHEARFIVDEVLGHGAGPESGSLDGAAVSAARAMADRRAAGEPLQYVFGHWPFRRLDLMVDQRVLIPRPETEQVVEVALAEAHRLAARRDGEGLVVVDAGTGSGAIALALATELGPRVLAELWATDASADALAVASANLQAVRRSDPAGARLPPLTLLEGSWLEPLPAHRHGHVDLVVSNPPYVSESEWDVLSAEVRREPRRALVAGASSDGTPGLADVEAVLRQARDSVRRPGAVVIELAPQQAAAAAALAQALGYDEAEVEPDLAGRARALVARCSE